MPWAYSTSRWTIGLDGRSTTRRPVQPPPLARPGGSSDEGHQRQETKGGNSWLRKIAGSWPSPRSYSPYSAGPSVAAAQDCNPLSNGVRCEGETMSIAVSGGRTVWGLDTAYTSGGALQLLERNGTATTNTTLPYTDKLTVRARGGQYCQGWPHMTLAVDGRQVLSQTVSQLGWKSYAVPVNLTAGNHSVGRRLRQRLLRIPTCNRNLRIDYRRRDRPAAPAQARSRARSARSRRPARGTCRRPRRARSPPATRTRASSRATARSCRSPARRTTPTTRARPSSPRRATHDHQREPDDRLVADA